MRTYAVRGATRKMTGHYRRPGTRTLYCGRPAGTPNDHARELAGFTLCAQCIKAEAAERAAAEQTLAAHTLDGLDLAKRAAVTLAMVGSGTRPHYTDGEGTLCGRPLDTDHRTEHAATLVRTGITVCQPCTRTAEQRAYVRTLATASRLAAAAVDLAETVEQADDARAAVEDAEAMYAARLVTEAEATDGTWRGEWIGAHTTPDAPALFSVDGDEQGALFT
jgi:hypothetical protein